MLCAREASRSCICDKRRLSSGPGYPSLQPKLPTVCPEGPFFHLPSDRFSVVREGTCHLHSQVLRLILRLSLLLPFSTFLELGELVDREVSDESGLPDEFGAVLWYV